jgi:hypothetical protein
VDAGFGVGIALDTDSFAGAFASAGVGGSALAANGQAAQMADAAVALNALEALEVHAQLAPQIAFDDVFAVLDGMNNLGQLLFIQVLGTDGGIDLGLGQDDFGIGRADAKDVAQSDVNSLLARDFNTNNTSHKMELALFLFVARVRAYNANHALAFNDFAIFAKFFD